MKEANISGKAGIYILRPSMSNDRAIFKLGMTENSSSRLNGSYKTDYPIILDSYELHGWMTTARAHARRRETAMFKHAEAHNFIKSPDDKEWYTYVGANFHVDIAKLFHAARQPIDGHYYVFDDKAKIVIKGGRQGINTFGLDFTAVNAPYRAYPNVTTRGAAASTARLWSSADGVRPMRLAT
jgi:hypothetical protein